MLTWIRLSRGVLGIIGLGALLIAGGSLLSGGGSLSDPVMPGGVALGLLAIGSAAWTFAPDAPRAVVVWIGLLAVAAAIVIVWINTGAMQTRDLLVYVGIPTAVVIFAIAGVAAGRLRSGALGGS